MKKLFGGSTDVGNVASGFPGDGDVTGNVYQLRNCRLFGCITRKYTLITDTVFDN